MQPAYSLHSPHDSLDSKGRDKRTYCIETADGRALPNICLVGDADGSFWRVAGRRVPARLVTGAIYRLLDRPHLRVTESSIKEREDG